MISAMPPRYVGRFAPSPSGPLHFGSLVAAVGSYLDARAQGGQWLVRMEDLDPPREVPGAAADILDTLAAFGFDWDGPVLRQSTREGAYRTALESLSAAGLIYPCGCTRREIADSRPGAAPLAGELVYPGTCRNGLPPGRQARALRIRVDDQPIGFDDGVQERLAEHSLTMTVGDFVVRRADGPFAYQLAVVVDDGEQGITDVVRGADLIDSTPRQIHLQRALGLPTPRYLHLPVVLDPAGEKLSKQTFATPLDRSAPERAIVRALAFLGQQRPPGDIAASIDSLWPWAIAHWRRDGIPRQRGAIAVD